MGFKDKLLGFVAPVDDDDEEEYEEETEYTQAETKPISTYETVRNAKVKKSVSSSTMITQFEPRTFEEAEEIAAHLKQGRATVVNLHRLQRDYAQRTIDFLAGAVFALDGKIQKIGHNVILCSPKSIGVEGEISLDNSDE